MKQFFTCATFILFSICAAAQVSIGYHLTAKDSLTNTILCSIPENYFGASFSAPVSIPGAKNITINGTDVTGSYSFLNISANKIWTIQYTDAHDNTFQHNLQFTFLPIVELNGNVTKTEFNIGNVRVLLPTENIESPCRMKFRGSQSNISTTQKHNYTLKFINSDGEKTDYKFFEDLRNDNTWILDAGTLDRLRIRNRVNTDLWLAMESKPYYAASEPKALNGSRGHMVEVFSNGEYLGLYNMCEPIDRKQLKLVKTDETNGTIHGQLWKSGQRSKTTRMVEAPYFNNTQEACNGFEVEYPDFDDVSPTDYTILSDAVKLVAQSSEQDFNSAVAQYIDIPVLQDYYIFLQMLLAYDNLGKNNYWAVYDKVKDKKITIIPWDLDTSWGQSWKNYEYHPTYLTPDYDIYRSGNTDNFIKRMVMWNVNGFVDNAAARYAQLRKDVLKTENILNRFKEYMDMLTLSGTIAREENRWVQNLDLGGYKLSLNQELDYVNQFITKRMEFLDTYFAPRIQGDVNDDREVDVDDVNGVINKILGSDDVPEIYNYKFDANKDMSIDVDDVNGIINWILKLDN